MVKSMLRRRIRRVRDILRSHYVLRDDISSGLPVRRAIRICGSTFGSLNQTPYSSSVMPRNAASDRFSLASEVCHGLTNSPIRSAVRSPRLKSSKNVGSRLRILDTDRPPFAGGLDLSSRYSVNNAQVLAAQIENLDFAVKAVPGVEKSDTRPSPTPRAVDVTQVLARVQESGFGDRLAAHPFRSIQ